MTAPLKFALVPADLTDEMRVSAWHAEDHGITVMYAAMLAASPGNDLLERMVSELNNSHAMACNHGYKRTADRIHALLNELGGGHG